MLQNQTPAMKADYNSLLLKIGSLTNVSDSFKRIASGLVAARRGHLPQMQARRVFYGYDMDEERAAIVHLTPVPFYVFSAELDLIKAAGYVASQINQSDIVCPICGNDKHTDIDYCLREDTGIVSPNKFRNFLICASCWSVQESYVLKYPAAKRNNSQ